MAHRLQTANSTGRASVGSGTAAATVSCVSVIAGVGGSDFWTDDVVMLLAVGVF